MNDKKPQGLTELLLGPVHTRPAMFLGGVLFQTLLFSLPAIFVLDLQMNISGTTDFFLGVIGDIRLDSQVFVKHHF